MDFQPQPQASFIPKKPLTTSVAVRQGPPNILWFIAVFIFVASAAAAAAVFLYGVYLAGSLRSAEDSLARAQAAYDPTAIEDLIRLNARIHEARNLLSRHAAPSAIFAFLESSTLSTVRFNQFEYDANPDGSVTLKLAGNATDFSSVALQSDQFGAATSTLKNVIFSDVNIDPGTGIVGFQVTANFNPQRLLYSFELAQGGITAPAPSPSSSVTTASQPGVQSSAAPAGGPGSSAPIPAPIPPQ